MNICVINIGYLYTKNLRNTHLLIFSLDYFNLNKKHKIIFFYSILRKFGDQLPNLFGKISNKYLNI